ncbi:MAG: class I SAM-dependent methyltransferase [Devosia sp.]
MGSISFWLDRVEKYLPDLASVSLNGFPAEPQPYWLNDFLPGLDAVLLYSMIRELAPPIYLEVGSGNSTKFVRKAIVDGHLDTKIISIDPHPRAIVDELCNEIIRLPVEDIPARELADLAASAQVIFIDNSHRSFQSSDVTVAFTEIIPAIAPGTYYGIHDIMLPLDYPDPWRDRFYNEQYLMAAYLLGGADGDRPIFPGLFATRENEDRLGRIFHHLIQQGVSQASVSLWMERRGSNTPQ